MRTRCRSPVFRRTNAGSSASRCRASRRRNACSSASAVSSSSRPCSLCALAALVPLYRRGWRAEAALIGGLSLAFLVYNAGYDVPFGGDSPGPRFLIPHPAVPRRAACALLCALAPAHGRARAHVRPLRSRRHGHRPAAGGGLGVARQHPGTATAPEVARFVPLVLAGGVLAWLAVRGLGVARLDEERAERSQVPAARRPDAVRALEVAAFQGALEL